MDKANKNAAKPRIIPALDDSSIFANVSEIIQSRKLRAQSHANQELVLMFWEIGKYIGSVFLGGERGAYGKQIVSSLAARLTARYGNSFGYENLTRMIKFAERFPDFQILVPLAQELSWSHIIALLPLKSDEAFMYYAHDAVARHLGKRELRHQISRKAFERCDIANAQITETSNVPFNAFKDPYLLDALGLKDNYLEADLERAILASLESFILEFGHGFTFAERQKRMTMDGDDYMLDLLFYHRGLKRLVAVELKVGKFKPAYAGQMRFYLKWLNRYERKEDENAPIGLLLCTEGNRDQIELMELDKDGIAVAEYWTQLPPKAEFEKRIDHILNEAKERIERRKSLPSGNQGQTAYYIDQTDDEEAESWRER